MKAVYPEAATQQEEPIGPRKLFDVTTVIGSVFEGGDIHPIVAALQLIGFHIANSKEPVGGEFVFPGENGEVYRVAIGVGDAIRK